MSDTDGGAANADHFNVAIFGPGLVQPSVWQCTWEAAPYGGDEPLTYEWFRNGELVGTDTWYSGAPANMTLSLHVTDAIGDTGLGIKNISSGADHGANSISSRHFKDVRYGLMISVDARCGR